MLQVLGKNGSVIANADDTNIPQPARNGQQAQPLVTPDPSLDLTIPGGTTEITLVIRDLENRGGIGFPYRIVVEPLSPDFELLANESQVSVPRGGTASMGVTVLRKGYSGPITVTVADPPAGLSVRPGTIAAGQATGALTLTASADASFPAGAAQARGAGSRRRRPVRAAGDEARWSTRSRTTSPCAASITSAWLRRRPCAPRWPSRHPRPRSKFPTDISATIPVKVVRTKGADAALAITALPLPAGLAVPKVEHRRESRRGQSYGERGGGCAPGNVDAGASGQGESSAAPTGFSTCPP